MTSSIPINRLYLVLYLIVPIFLPSFLKAHDITFLGSQSKAFSKPTNAKHKFFSFAKYFSCNRISIKMVFVVIHTDKTKMHLIIIHLLSYQLLNNSLSYPQNLLISFPLQGPLSKESPFPYNSLQ